MERFEWVFHSDIPARFQPRARGLKTSDEWVVPLCALHHRELHDRDDERAYWEGKGIDAESAARELWTGDQTRAEQDTGDGLALRKQTPEA